MLRITLTYGGNFQELTVEDNGGGFLIDSQSLGFGIRGMRKRADNISADLQIRSTPGVGTTVQAIARVPITLSRMSSIWHSLWEQRFNGQRKRKEADTVVDRR
jgi:glucose-6-phosphate-specific signal transduction histidine kinase